jgi:NitT/TauT family transport system substrate-binding protein
MHSPSTDQRASLSRSRRGVALAALVALAACGSRAATDPTIFRIGYLPNVTHSVALVAAHRGSFERALAPLTVEWKPFGAGPELMEALYAGALDAGYVGPGPAENGYLRSRGEVLVVVAGAASGGAALVVRGDARIYAPEDLHHKKLATPQLGNTQDVALRSWLMEQGLRSTDQGGDVLVMPIPNSTTAQLMQRGQLDGAWVPEPWVALLRLDPKVHARVLVDERTLWPGGRFATTVLVANRPSLASKPEAMAKLVRAHVAELRWMRAHPAEARAAVGEQIKRVTGKALPPAVLAAALDDVEPTWDPLPDSLAKLAEQARRLRYLPDGDLSGLLDRSLLDAALAADGGAP